jgi:hypothetical protein
MPSSERGPYFELNRYYAHPGRAADVLATRRRASALLVSLGQPVGRIYVNTVAAEGQPDVVWSCDYPSAAAREVSMAARAASPEFEATRRHMRTLYYRFERELFVLDDAAPPTTTR